MMGKRLLLLLPVFFVLAQNGFAQMNITLLDEVGNPVVGAKTQGFSRDGLLLFQHVSNAQGMVAVNGAELGSNLEVGIVVRLFGYEPLESTVSASADVILTLASEVAEQDAVIVTAQYGQSTVENSVHRIKVIDRAKMDAMGAVNLRDVLTNEMGVRLAQDNILGSSMSLQGISGENVKILIDGVPIVGRLNGNIDLSQINLNEIERIEIVEGPLSVNYGTNALAGVINLITKKPVRNQISAGAGGYYESIGHYNANMDVDFGSKHHSFGMSAGRNLFDGWNATHTTFQNPLPVADERRVMLWNPKEQLFGNLYYQFRKDRWNVRYKFDWFDEYVLNRGNPRQPYFITAFDDAYNTQRMDNSLNIKRRFGENGLLNTLFSYNRFDRIKNTFFVDLTSLEQQLTTNESDQDTSMFDQWLFRGSYATSNDSSKFNYQIGYEFLIESSLGRRILDGRQQQGDFAGFVTAEYRPWDRLVLRPGLRYAYNTTYDAPILPSINVKWSITNRLNWRSSYARGFRAPGIKELYFEFVDINHNIVGNENLNAESSHNLSTSFLHDLKKGLWKLQTEWMGFYNRITNRITLAAVDATQFSYVNIGSFQSVGTRFTFNYQRKGSRASAAIGWIGQASDVIAPELRDAFLFYPEVQGSFMHTVKNWNTSIGLFYKYQGRLPQFLVDENGNVTEGVTEDFHTMDVSISQKFLKESFNLTVGIKNLFDVTNVGTTAGAGGGAHAASSDAIAVGAGRSYFASLQYRIKHTNKVKQK